MKHETKSTNGEASRVLIEMIWNSNSTLLKSDLDSMIFAYNCGMRLAYAMTSPQIV